MSLQFCSECNNIMNPKVEDGNLMFVCGRCEIIMEPVSPIISSINFKKKHDVNASAAHDLVNDITLPRLNLTCSKCGNKECIGYMEKNEDKALDFYYVCTKCFFEWSD